MLVVPLILITMLFVVQFALAYHARTVVAGAAHDGASAAARRGASTTDGISIAESLVDQGAGSLLVARTVEATAADEFVTVTVRGEVVSLLPFFGTIRVSASGSARVEEFVGQGAGP